MNQGRSGIAADEAPHPDAVILQACVWYVAMACACIFAAGLGVAYIKNELFPSYREFRSWRAKPGMYSKVAFYRAHAKEFDTIFVGDSRTYCGIAPHIIDAGLGTKSINLSSFGNWFPTQYASLEAIGPRIPAGTTVVWSLGHQNFQAIANRAINDVYAIGLRNIPTYRGWGYTWAEISDNVWNGLYGVNLFMHRGRLREEIDRILDRPLVRAHRGSPPPPTSSHASDPGVMFVEALWDGSRTTSLALYGDRGNYTRIELDPDFFRNKQREGAANVKRPADPEFKPDPQYWKNFLGILDLLQRLKIHVIVNEFEETPYHYPTPEIREYYEKFMRTVRDLVRARGYPYIRIDFSQLTDADYFDYNHLNSSGIERYSRLFIPLLRDALATVR